MANRFRLNMSLLAVDIKVLPPASSLGPPSRSPSTHTRPFKSPSTVSKRVLVLVQEKERSRVQQAWMRGDVPVVVATIAFGMGINHLEVLVAPYRWIYIGRR